MVEAAQEVEEKSRPQHTCKIVESHMPQSKEQAAIKVAVDAVESNQQLMDIAYHIKTHYDKQYPGSGKATEGVYHAICGYHFACAPYMYSNLPECMHCRLSRPG
jgi:dynein light chain LC8-type